MSRLLLWRWGEPVEPLVEILDRGGLLAIPTESSYGLAADPWSREGVAAVRRVKGRILDPNRVPAGAPGGGWEDGKPLPVVAASAAQVAVLGADPAAPALARVAGAWPAPLSIVLPCDPGLPAAGGGSGVAVRVPDHPRLRHLLVLLGRPLTATSANRTGEEPILDPAALPALLAGERAAIVDDGVLPGGPPSTLVAPDGERYRVLRQGRYPLADLDRLWPAGE